MAHQLAEAGAELGGGEALGAVDVERLESTHTHTHTHTHTRTIPTACIVYR